MSLWALAGESGIRFSVKPRLCVLDADERECHDQLELVWSARAATSVCLFQSGKSLPLRCWEDEREGHHEVEIRTGDNIEFELREIEDGTPLVAERFEVVHDNKAFRHRRRNPWSFF